MILGSSNYNTLRCLKGPLSITNGRDSLNFDVDPIRVNKPNALITKAGEGREPSTRETGAPKWPLVYWT